MTNFYLINFTDGNIKYHEDYHASTTLQRYKI